MERETLLEALRALILWLKGCIAIGTRGSNRLKVTLISDSLSTLSALKANGPLGQKDGQLEAIWRELITLYEMGVDVTLMFVFAHAGHPGNIEVDKRAKAACQPGVIGTQWQKDIIRHIMQSTIDSSDLAAGKLIGFVRPP